MKLKNLFVTLALVALSVLLWSPVHADVLNFASGGAQGTITYDATTNIFPQWDITTSTSVGYAGVTYSNTIPDSSAGPGGFNGTGFCDFSIFSPTGGNLGQGGTLFFVVLLAQHAISFNRPSLP